MTLALMGEGECCVTARSSRRARRWRRPASRRSCSAPRKGLALINGTQTSTALALHALFMASSRCSKRRWCRRADGRRRARQRRPFDPRIHALRGQPARSTSRTYYRALLAGSAIRASHLVEGDDRVQDPYCLRCQPQVDGRLPRPAAPRRAVLLREANAVTDNPLVFARRDDTGRPPRGRKILSGGNFHAEPVALAADAMALAIAEVGAIAERRIAMLIDATSRACRRS
jgi:histidine ammonia-lyase